MKSNISVPPLDKNRNKSNAFLIFLLAFLLLGAIALGLYTVMTQQISTKSRADEVATNSATLEGTATPTPGGSESPTPEVSLTPTEVVTESSTLVETVTPTQIASSSAETVSTGGVSSEPTIAPTQALVSALSCPANGASCAWDAVNGASSYSVTVVDKTTNDVVLTQTISGTSVSFTPIIEHTYECSVQATNACGNSGSGKGQNTCSASVTPTATPAPSATPTPGPSATPTPGPSATPGPSVTPPSGTVIVRYVSGGPEPTIPSAGSASTVYFMIIATILAATLFLVF